MQELATKVFLLELRWQCCFALLASRDLDRALEHSETDRIWLSIHGLFAAVGNISKIFWPPRSKSRKRGGHLKRQLAIADDSPLKDRRLRNHLEHFDERIEQLVKEDRSFIDSNVGSADAKSGGVRLRHFDPSARMVSFADEAFHLAPLLEAVVELQGKVKEELASLVGGHPGAWDI